jgi:ATP-dependent Clp protease adaptor protein ClpS
MYRVLLHNDNMNRREYVVQALMKVIDGMTLEDAIAVMQEAHVNDIALVTVTSQETAEEYVTGLRRNGLTSTLEPSGSGGGGCRSEC